MELEPRNRDNIKQNCETPKYKTTALGSTVPTTNAYGNLSKKLVHIENKFTYGIVVINYF